MHEKSICYFCLGDFSCLVSLCSSYTIQLPHDPQVGLNNKNKKFRLTRWLVCNHENSSRDGHVISSIDPTQNVIIAVDIGWISWLFACCLHVIQVIRGCRGKGMSIGALSAINSYVSYVLAFTNVWDQSFVRKLTIQLGQPILWMHLLLTGECYDALHASQWLCSLYSRKKTTDQRVVFCVVTCAMAYTFLSKNIFIHIFRSR